MDFFGAQADARRRTALLLMLFVLVVAAVIGVLDVLATGLHMLRYGRPPPLQVHAWVGGSSLALIIGGSLWRTADLRDSGPALARLLHARPVDDPSLTQGVGAELLRLAPRRTIAPKRCGYCTSCELTWTSQTRKREHLLPASQLNLATH